MEPTLFVVATPIGNLEDVTLRALRVLREADLVLCEDTRVTKKLLTHYEIDTPVARYPFDTLKTGSKQTPHPNIARIKTHLREGKALALVVDAGTPAIADPGGALIRALQEEMPEVRIEAVPGASALIAALSVSGIAASSFLFLGFSPHKKGRETFFQKVADTSDTAVFYESPHRIEKTLAALTEHIEEKRRVAVARELTKLHEEVASGSASEVYARFTAHPETRRGEFVIVVEGRQ